MAKLFQNDHKIASERRFLSCILYSARIYTTCTAAPYKSNLIDRQRRRFGLTNHADFVSLCSHQAASQPILTYSHVFRVPPRFQSGVRWYVALHRPQLQIRLTNIRLYGTSGTNRTCQHRSMEMVHLMHRMGSTAAVFDSRFQACQQTPNPKSASAGRIIL